MAQVAGAGAGAGGVNGSESRNDSSGTEERDLRYWWGYVKHFCPRVVWALFTVVRVLLGDGVTRAKPGDRLEHTEMDCARRWTHTYGDRDEPAHPPMLEPGKEWRFIGPGSHHYAVVPEAEIAEAHAVLLISVLCVESREIRRARISEDDVVVFREGMAFPTTELISVVNSAHAVLVLRGENDYFYLHDDIVLSAREEEALAEWGIGQPVLGYMCLAAGGTILVVVFDNIRGPAVVGALLVATATYRVQGILTKVLRIRSSEWETKHKLVPSGIHGTERVIQGVLVTLVALADLLDHRMLLLSTVILASVQVVLLEFASQKYLTLGYESHQYLNMGYEGIYVLGKPFWLVPSMVMGVLAWVALSGFFPLVFGCMCLGLVVFLVYMPVMAGCLGGWSRDKDDRRFKGRWITVPMALLFFGSVGVGIWATVLKWDDAGPKGLLSLARAAYSFWTVVRLIGVVVWICMSGFLMVLYIIASISFGFVRDVGRVTRLGERTRTRKKENSPGFSHYDENPIPSRNLLVAGVGQPAPVASIV